MSIIEATPVVANMESESDKQAKLRQAIFRNLVKKQIAAHRTLFDDFPWPIFKDNSVECHGNKGCEALQLMDEVLSDPSERSVVVAQFSLDGGVDTDHRQERQLLRALQIGPSHKPLQTAEFDGGVVNLLRTLTPSAALLEKQILVDGAVSSVQYICATKEISV